MVENGIVPAQLESATPSIWTPYGGGQVALAATLLHHNFTVSLLLTRFSAGMLRVCAGVEQVAWV